MIGKKLLDRIYLVKRRGVPLLFFFSIIGMSLTISYLGWKTVLYRNIALNNISRENAFNSAVLLLNLIENEIINIEKKMLSEINRYGVEDIIERYELVDAIYIFDKNYNIKSIYRIKNMEKEIEDIILYKLSYSLKEIPKEEMSINNLSEELNNRKFQICYSAILKDNKNIGFIAIFINSDLIRDNIIDKIITDYNKGEIEENGIKIVPTLRISLSRNRDHKAFIEIPFKRVCTFYTISAYRKDITPPLYNRVEIIYISIICINFILISMGIRAMYREIRRSRIRSELSAKLSHELKTPLSLIRMFGETLMMGRIRDNKKRMEYYRIITRESERLTNLINNILDFNEIEENIKRYNIKRGNIGETIKRVIDNYSILKDGFRFNLELESSLPEVKFDEDAISQALINLIDNAVKYSGEEKEVKIRVYSKSEGIILEVIDKGIGIDKRDKKRIFEPLYRGEIHKKGSGLGLSIVKHIVESHRGKIRVESERGKGSKFIITLPV
jgi:signal transduction histidine kinase